MLLSVLFQILTLLPPTPEWETIPADEAYRAEVRALAIESIWSDSRLQRLHIATSSQERVLAEFLRRGSDVEVRLAALLSAGTEGDSKLGHALWRRAAQGFDEARVLACLLAPASVPAEALPSLAWIASDPRRSLPQRAAACARLLDAGVLTAWPLANAILRTGTTSDHHESFADWRRGGRYELPKRILLLSIEDLLERHQLPASDFEPNAAWAAQEDSLAVLGAAIQGISSHGPTLNSSIRSWRALLLQKERGQPVAIRAFRLLQP